MKIYTQLIQEEKYQIYVLMKTRHKQTEISRILCRDKSTISRELRRDRGLRSYQPGQAQWLALQCRQSRVHIRIGAETGHWVEHLLQDPRGLESGAYQSLAESADKYLNQP